MILILLEQKRKGLSENEGWSHIILNGELNFPQAPYCTAVWQFGNRERHGDGDGGPVRVTLHSLTTQMHAFSFYLHISNQINSIQPHSFQKPCTVDSGGYPISNSNIFLSLLITICYFYQLLNGQRLWTLTRLRKILYALHELKLSQEK